MALPIPILGSIIDNVFGYFTMSKTKKEELKQIKEKSKVNSLRLKDELNVAKERAKIERVARNDNIESNYDMIAQENARNSIVDEVMIFWVLCIITLIFIPDMQPYVISGFKALEDHVPVWFQTVFVGAFISKLGLRFLFSGRTLFPKK